MTGGALIGKVLRREGVAVEQEGKNVAREGGDAAAQGGRRVPKATDTVVPTTAADDAADLLGTTESAAKPVPPAKGGTSTEPVGGVTARGAAGTVPDAEALAARQPMTHIVTDTEGSRGRIDALVASGKLRIEGDRLEFTNPGDRLLFAGDLTDRGPHSIQLTRWMNDLHDRYPDRVTILYGNRDLNKLSLMRDLPSLEGTPTGEYAAYLAKRGPSEPNTLANRVGYWLESHSSRDALELHRTEMSAMRGTEVTRDQAAEDYVRRMAPGGEFFEYLRRGQFIDIRPGGVIADHSGITTTNMGIVPGQTRRLEANEWAPALNGWARNQLDAIEAAYRARGPGAHIPDDLMRYGDGIWQQNVGPEGRLWHHDQSVSYGPRVVEDGNFRVPQESVREYLARSGIHTEIVGHSPAGDVPTPLRTPGYMRMMGDTSFSGDGAWTTMSLDARGGVRVSGMTRAGDPITYRTSPTAAPPIGHVTDSGYTVIGRNREDGATHYVIGKYYNGHVVDQRVVSRDDLMRMRPRPAELTGARSEADVANRDALIENLRARGARIRSLGDDLYDVTAGRRPVVFSGSSKWGNLPTSPEAVQREVSAMFDRLDPQRSVILTGGTDVGVEKFVHEEARRRGIPVVGFIQEGAIPQEIGLVNNFVLAGARDQWDDPLRASLNFASENNGFAVFIGGGPVVSGGIEVAQNLGMRHFMMRPRADLAGDGGASVVAGQGLTPELARQRTFGTAEDLFPWFRELGVGVN